jgi:septal ring factor EnvC (AmiA/AmiB activator)
MLRYFVFSLFFLPMSIFQFPSVTSLPCVPKAFAERPQEEYKRIQKDIRTRSEQLESVKKEEQSVLEDLRKTTFGLNEIETRLDSQRAKIRRLNSNIMALQGEIASDSSVLQSQQERLKRRLRSLMMFTSNRDTLLALLSGEDVAQTLRIERYLRDISEFDYNLIKRYKGELQALAEKQTALRNLIADQTVQEKKLSKLEASLKDKQEQREVLLAKIRKEKGAYENMIRELKDASNRLLAIIRETEKKEQEAKRKRIGRAGPGQKQEEIPEDSLFRKMKGTLSWPVIGKVLLQYGTQLDPVFNLPVFRSGIYVKADSGTPVKAVHEGKVVFADNFRGYGELVIVSHGSGYHTLYGNLSKIFSKIGAIIKDQQVIGEVGESDTLGTSSLYFEIRYKGKPLDPLQWLRK